MKVKNTRKRKKVEVKNLRKMAELKISKIKKIFLNVSETEKRDKKF